MSETTAENLGNLKNDINKNNKYFFYNALKQNGNRDCLLSKLRYGSQQLLCLLFVPQNETRSAEPTKNWTRVLIFF